jgi:hypothetical protein
MKAFVVLLMAVFCLTGCQFTETMVLNEDGTGRMTLEMDMSEMMAFGAGMDTSKVKMDTLIAMKDVLMEKKDSIAKLPMEEQKRLKAMENYNLGMNMDSEKGIMVINMFTDFTDVSEADKLMKGLEGSGQLLPDMGSTKATTSNETKDVLGVAYSFKKGVFKRDAFINDTEAHQQQLDSLSQAESFMSTMKYKIKYTFPKKIKKVSVEDATYSLDGKTLTLERSFMDYFKNPDVLDIEVELEK